MLHTTYRLQLHGGFTFRQAADLVDYLGNLGVSHIYVSPFLKARPGSTHGYDIVDHSELNPEIGTREDLHSLIRVLRGQDMGLILDVVPNHMAVMGSDNAWWTDVLENGPASYYADYFDIDWRPQKEALRGKVLVAVLGDAYGVVLERGELELRFNAEAGSFAVHYYEHLFPVDPATYPEILTFVAHELRREVGGEHPTALKLEGLISALEKLPSRERVDEGRRRERMRDKELLKERLAELYGADETLKRSLHQGLEEFCRDDHGEREGNGAGEGQGPGAGLEPGTRRLHQLLEAQAYRLAHWKTASHEINYRRFFNINHLAGLKVEREEVFEATHELVLELVREGWVQGLRIDHPDGLHDPEAYFRRLQKALRDAADARDRGEASSSASSAVSSSKSSSASKVPYLVVEKILAHHERLRESWPIDGTTGYDFCNQLDALFVDAAGERHLTRIYSQFLRRRRDLDEIVYWGKKRIIQSSLMSELNVLADMLNRLSEADPKTRDFTRAALQAALEEVAACFPVYRTYVNEDGASELDRRYVAWAVAQAKKRSSHSEPSVFQFVHDALLGRLGQGKEAPHGASGEIAEAGKRFAMKFQQYSAPVMAKGLEDTAFYSYNRLLSLNEVGGEPGRFGLSLKAFHYHNAERQARWPRAMLTSTTHDTKRSEDVRARLHVFSEVPHEWAQRVRRWRRLTRSKKRRVHGALAPSRNDEYALYQTILGAFPPALLKSVAEDGESGPPDWSKDQLEELERFSARVRGYMNKAVREAKEMSSWVNPDGDYEAAVSEFTTALLAHPESNPFLQEFLPFAKRVARVGMLNSLAAVCLKLCSPGVPDLYQGTELWDFSLVDPDNRRPVDYEKRMELLAFMQGSWPDTKWAGSGQVGPDYKTQWLWERLWDGQIKMYTVWRLLQLRSSEPELFLKGEYIPLHAKGARSENVCAFARRYRGHVLVCVVPRLIGGLTDMGRRLVWGDIWYDGDRGRGTWLDIPRNCNVRGMEDCFTDAPHRTQEIRQRSRYRETPRDCETSEPIGRYLSHFPVSVWSNVSRTSRWIK